MQKLIILPGNSIKNKAWGEACRDHFGTWFGAVYLQYYSHWEKGTNEIDFEEELQKLQKEVLPSEADTEFIVFAKSVGSLITLIAVQGGIVTPTQCVFFGMPLDLAAEGLFKNDWSSLSDFSVSSIAFHNDHDPTANCEFTKNKLEEVSSSIQLIHVQGDDHVYAPFEPYEDQIKNFLMI